MEYFPVASAHGRFQPLHNEHLEYLLEAKRRCDFLWVGITQINIENLSKSPANPHRAEPANNPLSYFERVEMISNALTDHGLVKDEFGIIPFPIEDNNCLSNFLPTNIPIFTTICDEWNLFKKQLLESKGYKVIILKERHGKILRGVQIRKEIRQEKDIWMHKVPQATIEAVNRNNIKYRLQKLGRDRGHP